MRRHLARQDLLILLILLLLPVLLLTPTTLGGKTLLPVDNLFAYQPWQSFAAQLGVGVPHNSLLSDLILENYVWKRFILESLRARQIPLWNPYIVAGEPFLAAGQHSALYPLSILFYVLPIPVAYGWFSALQLGLAGIFAYIFLRVIGANRFGATIAGITYQLSGFMVVSVVFTMMIAAAAWLPLILAMVEVVIKKQEGKGPVAYSPVPYIAVGAWAMGMQVLAGHIEITAYVLLVSAFYALCRLVTMALRLTYRSQNWGQALRVTARLALWIAAMVLLGLGLGGVQLIPLLELLPRNFRVGSVTYADVVGWALPLRQAITFLVPDFFGNPSHHAYFDLLSWSWQPTMVNARGQPTDTIFWGIKNYVEAGSYVGILPLCLALIAILGVIRNPFSPRKRVSTDQRLALPHVLIFTVLAMLAIAFAFGTPLYAFLYYGVPGWNQLHSPFRWVFPYTLSIAVLAGIGATCLSGTARQMTSANSPFIGPYTMLRAGWPIFWGGVAALALLLLALAIPGPFIALADRFVRASDLAQGAFADGRMFFSYQWRNFFIFALFVAASGAVIRVSRCPIYLPARLGGYGVWKPLALVVLVMDLFLVGYGFNPAADPALLDFTPPVVKFLKEDKSLYRITSFDAPGEKTFIANAGEFYGIQDVRGYDSIIPRQYGDYVSLITPQYDNLLYNRIGGIYVPDYQALDSPLLDLLGAKYVLTTRHIPNAGYRLVYDKEIRVYENEDVLPRAFTQVCAQAVPVGELSARLRRLDPPRSLLLEEEAVPPETRFLGENGFLPCALAPAEVVRYTNNEVEVRTSGGTARWLVLADSYFPGWKAYVRLDEAQTPKTPGVSETPGVWEQEIPIYRAYGNFRAVPLAPGSYLVRFTYTPMSFKLGLYTTFLSAVVILLLVGQWAWWRIYRETADDTAVKRVAKNSLVPMAASLLNKVVDFAFALLMLRILAPEGAGRYQFAVVFIGYFDILVRFGLGTLLTREVAKEPDEANRYFSNVTILRTLLWLASLPLMAVVLLLYMRFGGLTGDVVLAIALFAVSLFFSNVSDGLSALFYAFEKMEYPAGISTVTAMLRVTLGVLALLAGGGFIGLAAVSIVVNIITMAILGSILVRGFFRPHWENDPAFQRQMLDISFPLMINNLLATIFFRIDVLILKPLKGDAIVGYYGAAYKYVDGLNIIPAYFTLAIFPLMSRYARSARDSLMRAYILSLRLLLIISLPIAAGTPFIARELILLLGGSEYLPHSMIALQLLIGFLPFSYVNSVTQYVLIAIDEQRFLTKAFLIGVAFNVVANLLFIPRFGYQAAAVITILSEIVLLIPFYYCVRRNLGALPWVAIAWRPAVASAAMGMVLWLVRSSGPLVILPVGAIVYTVALVALGTFRDPDVALVLQLIPVGRLGARLAAVVRGGVG
jgi:O-antigen/teichoic acid export membrane protein